jgi:hypothetical protein
MAPNDQVVMQDVKLIFKNFSGREGMYNQEGERNFAVLLDPDTAEAMAADGWHVKWLKAREEGDEEQAYLSVSVKYKRRDGRRVVYPPRVVMITEANKTELDETTIDILDSVDMKTVDLIFRPSAWSVNGGSGIKAYLASMYVTINEDPLSQKYGM